MHVDSTAGKLAATQVKPGEVKGPKGVKQKVRQDSGEPSHGSG
jgi:hypothetical protein